MSDSSKDPRTKAQLMAQNDELQRRLAEAEQTLEAIRHGDVDALVMDSPKGELVYSLTGAEHIYRVIVETMNEAALTVDPDGTILFCNQRFCQLFKTSIQGVMGRKVTAFVARPQQPPLRELLTNAAVGPVERRLLLQAVDGTPVPAQLSASPLRAGDSLSLCLVISDLTELERSASSIRVLREHEQDMQEANERLQMQSEELRTTNEELQAQQEELRAANEELQTQAEELRENALALQASEERFRSVLDHSRDVIYRLNVQTGHYEYISPSAETIVGYSPAELRTEDIQAALTMIHPDDLAAMREGLARLEKTGLAEMEYRQRTKSGAYRWLSNNMSLVRDSTGRPLYRDGNIRDITERKRAEEALRDLNATLEGKVAQRTAELTQRARQLQKMTLEVSRAEDRERKRMAEILHDDLQQIIAGAKFHLNLLRNRLKHDASVQAIGAQIDEMLKDAMEKSRGLSHELSPVVLHHGDFTETLRWLGGQIQAKHGLVVHVQAPAKMDLQSDGTKMFLYRTAQELLFNVVKHARVQEARIRTRRCGPYVCLSVSDRGRGFDPRQLQQAPGYGLLSIREQIELLRGRMRIKSAPGRGSTLFVVVPDFEIAGADCAAQTAVIGPATDAGQSAENERRRLRVLLADDHRIVREGLRSLLKDEHDIEIVGEAVHGREAVDLAMQLEPDVVIMDVSMPLINGDEATQQIKARLPQTRVIALSTYNEPQMIRKMYEAGAEGYVLKTASAAELLAAIRGRNTSGS